MAPMANQKWSQFAGPSSPVFGPPPASTPLSICALTAAMHASTAGGACLCAELGAAKTSTQLITGTIDTSNLRMPLPPSLVWFASVNRTAARDIRQMADLAPKISQVAGVSRRSVAEAASVLVRFVILTREPLSGEVGVEDAPGEPFVGWLGLLRALSRLLEVDAATGDVGGELGA